MLTFNTFNILAAAVVFSLLLAGCGAGHSGSPTAAKTATAPSRPAEQTPRIQQPSDSGQVATETNETAQLADQGAIFSRRKPQDSVEIAVDQGYVEFVEQRLLHYETKFEQWLELSEMDLEDELAEELAAIEPECLRQMERILTGYSLLLERMRQNNTVSIARLATIDPKNMQQLDIAFLESRCGALLAMGTFGSFAFKPERTAEPSFEDVQKTIISLVDQGDYQEALLAYSNLAHSFPGQKPFPATRISYGTALQYTGQVEAAARHFSSLLESEELVVTPLSLQREIADLLLASGNVAAAESHYDALILTHESIDAEKIWAEEQLAFLRSYDPESEEMIAYLKLLREFQTYDYREYAPELNEKIKAFATEYVGSPVAVSALRLKTFATAQLKAWFGRQLVKIDALVAEKNFAAASDILKNMSRYYLPAELQAVVQKTYYEVAQAEIQEIETQRRIQEMELNEQWDAAVNLMDSQRYELAIYAFEALQGTEYEEKAKLKIIETANQAASQMRKEAAALFVRAGKTSDFGQKKELLLASHRLLTGIPVKFPQTELLDKVQQNISILEEQIQRFDPALLEELRQQDSGDSVAEPPASYSSGQPR